MPLPRLGFSRAFAFVLLLAVAPLGHGALAADDSNAFIVQLGEQAAATMTDRTISSAVRLQRFGAIVDRDFDVPEIAQFMLGRYWETATQADRDDFTNVFRDYMIRIYADNFANFSSESFRVVDQRPGSESTTTVRTQITEIATGQPIVIEWRLVRKPEGLKVLDLSVGGISLAIAQQEEFASAIQRSGGQVSALTLMIRSKLTKMETAAQ